MEAEKKHSILDLSQTELHSIDEYRKKRNTAILTIMFTDIQGFTALTENKGETYVHALHQEHDKILVNSIEENNAGIVIKYIGDSIMAVFSEPTAAAEKALKIQKSLDEFNKSHPDMDDIKVRIGLHMGQTVIENKIQTDLFGRHVNKASRVESLAAGGHIYVSYPVFDSIKSWLMDAKSASSKFHGSYFLKGISKAEDIYEIYNTEITRHEAPKKARKKNSLFPALPLALVVILLGTAGLLYMYRSLSTVKTPKQTVAVQDIPQANEPANEPAGKEPSATQPTQTVGATPAASAPTVPTQVPEVYFLGMIAREPILDFNTPLAVSIENEAQGLKKSINDISAGKHIIHYIVSYMVRYYAEFTVKEGKNVIQIVFKESYLPNIDAHLTVNETSEKAEPEIRNTESSYFLFDRKTLKRIDYTGKLQLELQGNKNDDGTISYSARYNVTLNGKLKAEGTADIESPGDQKNRVYGDEKILYEDQDHYYFYKYSYAGNTLQFSLGSSFKK